MFFVAGKALKMSLFLLFFLKTCRCKVRHIYLENSNLIVIYTSSESTPGYNYFFAVFIVAIL